MIDQQRRIDLESAGYCIGDAEDFLEFNDDKIEFKYRGYSGKVEFDMECNMFCGRMIHHTDVVTFKGVTFREARLAFEDSVDDYLEFCREF